VFPLFRRGFPSLMKVSFLLIMKLVPRLKSYISGIEYFKNYFYPPFSLNLQVSRKNIIKQVR
jgi:hypothetical protein